MPTLTATLQYSAGSSGPFQTIAAPCRVSDPPRSYRGRQDGYGSRIPTCYEVSVNGRWRRVYCCQWSNAGTCYVEDRSVPKRITEGGKVPRYPWIVVRGVA